MAQVIFADWNGVLEFLVLEQLHKLVSLGRFLCWYNAEETLLLVCIALSSINGWVFECVLCDGRKI